MPGTCMRSISHSLGPKRVLAFRQLRVLGFRPQADLTIALEFLKPEPSSCNTPGPRQYLIRSFASMSSAAEQPESAATSKPELPPLSPYELKEYSRLAVRMNAFHEHFRQTWTMLYNAAASNRRPQGMSIKQFIDQGLQFIQHLEGHHGIEEQYVFPELAKKMPEFQAAGKNHKAAELLQQHKQIHKGMDVFDKYLRDCTRGEKDFEMRVLKEQMDTWADVLRLHLDQEVETLAPENLRKYYTVEEVRRLPM